MGTWRQYEAGTEPSHRTRYPEKIQRLEPQQLSEVIDFIDFLVWKSLKWSPLMQLLGETAGARVGLEEVRRRLAKIPGNMSETVRDLRDERG
jgi:hypothetical protein